MTIEPAEAEHATPAAAIASPRLEGWRISVGIGVWVSLTMCTVALAFLLVNMFAMAVGAALHAEVTVEEQLPVFWALVTVCVVLLLTAVAAIVGQRWVALILAIIIGAAGGFLTTVVFYNVQDAVMPVTHTDPQPMPCQCHSGGTCDCPGG